MSLVAILVLIYRILYFVIYAYMLAMFVSVLLSWFPNARGTALDRILGRIVDPFLDLVRRFLPMFGGLDFSPIVAFFILSVAQEGLKYLLFMIVGAVNG